MSRYIPGNQKHLILEDRIYIENELNKGTSFKEIAKFLCKDPTTISKEVKAHRLSDWYHNGTFYNAKNFCIHRYHCKKTNACGKIVLCGVKCTSFPTCNQTCKDFEKERCNRLNKAPYVCNGCPKKSIVVQSLTNIHTMQDFLTTNIAKNFLISELESILPGWNSVKKTGLFHRLLNRGCHPIRLSPTSPNWIFLPGLFIPISIRGVHSAKCQFET